VAIWSRLTGIIAGIGISNAASVVIEPALEAKRQDAWLAAKSAILEPPDLAILVAQGWIPLEDAQAEALRNGFTADKFNNLVNAATAAAPIAQALEIWRRQPDKAAWQPLFDHAMAKAQIDERYWPYIADLYTTRVPADLLAFAHQRGIVPNPQDPVTGQLLIPVSAPTTSALDLAGGPSPIRQDPIPIDVLAEFASTGWNFERAAVNARARGLPPAPGELLQLVNRKVISVSEYYAGIGEGDTRNEWRDYLLALRRRLLTPHDYAELFLRGWIDQPTRDAGAALSGMEAADTQLLYQMIGRPLSALTITKGLSRGGAYQPLAGEILDPYLAAAHQSNIRTEWYDLWVAAGKYAYPPLFQTISMLKAGTVSPDIAAQWLLHDGYEPTAVGQIVDAYATPASTTNTHLKSAQTSLVTATRKAYLGGSITPAQAQTALSSAGVPAATQAQMLDVWNANLALEQIVAPPAPIIAPPGGG